jgi:hypothetical protein
MPSSNNSGADHIGIEHGLVLLCVVGCSSERCVVGSPGLLAERSAVARHSPIREGADYFLAIAPGVSRVSGDPNLVHKHNNRRELVTVNGGTVIQEVFA